VVRSGGRPAPSRTAGLVALYRAIESARPAETRLFEDLLAPAFLGWRFRWALRLSRLPLLGAALPWSAVDGHWSGPRGTVAVRTRYIDDALGQALASGAEQVVILGAGFDCRAYRIARIEDVDARVYRERDLLPRGRGREPLADFQRAALVEVDHR
jgi:methyltransferase (TIGR00027 family)